jgi:hypothetical protein
MWRMLRERLTDVNEERPTHFRGRTSIQSMLAGHVLAMSVRDAKDSP